MKLQAFITQNTPVTIDGTGGNGFWQKANAHGFELLGILKHRPSMVLLSSVYSLLIILLWSYKYLWEPTGYTLKYPCPHRWHGWAWIFGQKANAHGFDLLGILKHSPSMVLLSCAYSLLIILLRLWSYKYLFKEPTGYTRKYPCPHRWHGWAWIWVKSKRSRIRSFGNFETPPIYGLAQLCLLSRNIIITVMKYLWEPTGYTQNTPARIEVTGGHGSDGFDLKNKGQYI